MKQEKLTDLQIAGFCRSLALQLHAGIGLADSVFLLAQEEIGWLRQAFLEMGKQLDAGAELSETLRACGCFPDYMSEMAAVGNRTGRLEETLELLGDHYEERHHTAQHIRSALTYPGMVFALMLLVIAVLLVKVLPVFDRVYASLGGGLTGMAAGLMKFGQLLGDCLPWIAGISAAGMGFGLLCVLWRPLRERISGWFREKFGDRGVLATRNNARFARVVAMGLACGLPLEEAAEMGRGLLRNVPRAAARCGLCLQLLKEGASLADAMSAGKLLSPAKSRMLAVGLKGGSGDRVMEQIADALSKEAEEKIENMVGIIEPAMVLVTSLLVGLILLTVMLPLLDIMSTIG